MSCFAETEYAVSRMIPTHININDLEIYQLTLPSYKELSGSRNAVEKVLALEIKLAEALEFREESNDHFRSTLLKQHKGDEALFQSFRDVNELIKDMLEMKRRHETMDNELKDMHGRYSELSLRFAEVEGERQKLMMIVKNIKLPKRQ